MKKTISLLLAIIMLLSLAACKDNGDGKNDVYLFTAALPSLFIIAPHIVGKVLVN